MRLVFKKCILNILFKITNKVTFETNYNSSIYIFIKNNYDSYLKRKFYRSNTCLTKATLIVIFL